MTGLLAENVDTVELFAGPGGWDEGASTAGLPGVIDGLELAPGAVATARAAGHRRRHCDVLSVDPVEYHFATGLIASPPCPTFSDGGLRTGRGSDYQTVLDVWTSIGWGISADDAIRDLPDQVSDPRTALLATAGVWALSLPNLRWLAFEQVPAVEFAWEDLAAELSDAGWESVNVERINATEAGAASRRDRVYLVASRYVPTSISIPNAPTRTMADELGWDAGHKVITRGNRKPTGGNAFSADGPSWCLTGRSRSWYRDDGLPLTASEAGALSGFRRDYPWQGSRTAQFQQAGDCVSPLVAEHIFNQLAPATGAHRIDSLAA